MRDWDVLIRHVSRTVKGDVGSLVVVLRGHEPGEICHDSEPIGLHELFLDDLHRALSVSHTAVVPVTVAFLSQTEPISPLVLNRRRHPRKPIRGSTGNPTVLGRFITRPASVRRAVATNDLPVPS
ncbi:hypothetical protein V6N11_067177 [Hibiscus sabdariffa]|uniref:Uncharacterized protein n=1 Tax=Hibiscus sabdariffa TaxID=183260 RepID=A0ABR2SQT2_9ROSI